jgi:hypothetical protein
LQAFFLQGDRRKIRSGRKILQLPRNYHEIWPFFDQRFILCDLKNVYGLVKCRNIGVETKTA